MAPVLTNVLNECGACGCEIVGRKAVEALVTGEEKTYLSTENMRKRVYPSGSSFLYGSFHASKVSALYSFGASYDDLRGEKFVRCKCAGFALGGGPMTMVREEFREMLSRKLGGKLTFSLLFSLPPGMVAWENSGYVKVGRGSGGYDLSEDGVDLVDIIRDMSRNGVFEGGLPRLEASDVVDGYTYLYMVKPKYRAIVASDFGPKVGLGELLAKVPLDWVDWRSALVLKSEQKDGGIVLSRFVGAPLVATLFSFFRESKSSQVGGACGKSVVAGVAVSSSGTCVQFMPQCEQDEGYGWSFSSPDYAVLAPGTVFLPSGRVVLRGEALAVTFEPGVVVQTKRRSLVRNSYGGVTVFVNGDIDVELHRVDCVGAEYCSCETVASETRAFTVAAVCDSYAKGTALRKWYDRRFDTASTEARFFTRSAEFVVLCMPHCERNIDERVVKQYYPEVGSSMGDGIGKVACTVGALEDGDPVLISNANQVLSNVESGSHLRELWFNGSVRVGESGCVGFTGCVEMTAVFVDTGSYASVKDPSDRQWLAKPSFELQRVIDAYVVDGGGPSGSDDYYDETSTYSPGRLGGPLGVIQQLVRESKGEGRFSMTHRVLGDDSETFLYHLGQHPQLGDILGADLRLIDLSMVELTGLSRTKYGYAVVRSDGCQFTWCDVLRFARSWTCSFDRGVTLMSHLSRMHPDVANEPVLMKGGRCE